MDHATKQSIAIKDVSGIITKNKTGAARLLAKYKIDLVNGANGVTKSEYNKAKAYYTSKYGNMDNALVAALQKEFGGVGQKYNVSAADLKPVADYYINPTEATIDKIAQAANDSSNYGQYLNTLEDINLDLSAKVSRLLGTKYAQN